jgi:outer membrane protein insertion porin family
MNKIIIYSFLFFNLLFSILHAEIVNKVIIVGNERVSDETIKIYGKIDLNVDYSNKDLDQILKNLYSTDFFEDINVKLENNTLKISLKEYPIINQLIIIGEKSNKYKDAIKDLMSIKEKSSFIKSNLIKDVEKIKLLYSSIGYNSSKVETKLKKNDNQSFDLLIEINKGEKTKISSINFIGNNNIRSSRLKDIIASEEKAFWKVITKNTNFNESQINLDIRLLTNYYKSLGYFYVKVNSNLAQLNKTGNVDLVYSIEEGNRYTINKISTKVDKTFDKKIFFPLNKVYKKHVGEYYSPFTVKKLLEELDELIDNNDLQFVEHNVEEVVEGKSINITFNVMEGEKNLVERINIIGNSVTNEDVIRGELIIDEGDPFTKLNIDKSIAKIKSRNIFSKVKYDVVNGSDKNLKIINIEVAEQPTGEISAGAGFGTNGGQVAFVVKENNWLGEGKSLTFDVELDAESLSGELIYSDPNYNFLGNSLNYSISSESNDKPDRGYKNSVYSAGIGTSFEQYKDVTASLGINASYDDLSTTGNASQSLKNQAGSFSELAGSYGFTYDKRNRTFMPTDGSIISFSQSLPIYADKSFLANQFLSSSYKTLSENVIGASKIYLGSISGLSDDNVRVSKRLSLSTKRLRGFQKNKVGPVDGDDHIGGNYVAAYNLEANLPNFLPEDTNTDINLFLDAGNIWGVDYDSSIDDSNKIRSTTGVSASWKSPVGPMTFTFSKNLTKADTDKTEAFNFSLGTTF